MNTLRRNKQRGSLVNLAFIILAFVVVYILSITMDDNSYRRTLIPIIWQMCIFILLGASLNLTLGGLGQLTLGHMGFAGIGAYTVALVSLALERAGLFDAKTASAGTLIIVILGCCLLGAILAGLIGLLVGIPALRLRGDYLAIVTLGFGLIVENVLANLPFAGGNGLAEGTASSSLYCNGLGLSSSLQAKYVWLVLTVTVLCIVVMWMFVSSKYGRAIKAIRDDEIAASASGVNTTFYKILTFSFSAFFAGLAGGLYATCFSSLATSTFTFASSSIWNSTFIVVLVVLGGMGSMTGSVISAIVMYLLNYEIKNGGWVSAMPQFIQNLFQFPMLIYAIVLMIVIMFRPRGMLGTYEFSLDRLLFGSEGRRQKGRKKGAAENG
jgi:branched-chain amino acid transport system permease protein